MLLGLETKVMSTGSSLADKVRIIRCCSYVLSDNILYGLNMSLRV